MVILRFRLSQTYSTLVRIVRKLSQCDRMFLDFGLRTSTRFVRSPIRVGNFRRLVQRVNLRLCNPIKLQIASADSNLVDF